MIRYLWQVYQNENNNNNKFLKILMSERYRKRNILGHGEKCFAKLNVFIFLLLCTMAIFESLPTVDKMYILLFNL